MAEAKQTAVKAMIEALGVHLRANMPSLAQVIYDFPAPNVKLLYPSVSLISPNPLFTPTDPYILEQGSIVRNKATVAYVVGTWETSLQIDLWARDKVERSNLLEEFFLAINPEIKPMGLSLQLSKYHDIWARFDMTGNSLEDSEVSSQRAEWRAKINVLANTRAILEKSEYVMSEFTTTLTLPNVIDE